MVRRTWGYLGLTLSKTSSATSGPVFHGAFPEVQRHGRVPADGAGAAARAALGLCGAQRDLVHGLLARLFPERHGFYGSYALLGAWFHLV